jgi:hypothetical protein
MKQITTLFLFLFLCLDSIAQETQRIAISAVLPDNTSIPQASINMLQNKMKNIITTNGFADESEQRFVLTANIDILEQGHNSAGMLMQKMTITFYVGDILENKVYSSAIVNVLGVGQSDTKACNMAFQKISPSTPEIKQALNEANKKIVDYYTFHYSDLISEVNRLVEMEQFDEAIAKLITVPSVCVESYNDAQNRSVEIYHKKMNALAAQQKAKTDKEGLVLIQQAKAAWSSKQDYESASNALTILAQIDPEAGCIEEANKFIQSINDTLRTDERNKAAAAAAIAKRDWEFKMRQYEDNLEMAKQKQADKTAILGTLANRFGKFDISIQKEKTSRWGIAK